MREFVRKQNQAQKGNSINPTKAGRLEQYPDQGLSVTAALLFGHDFSRIPVYRVAPVAVQPGQAISTPGDSHEQEAERVAQQVTRTPEPPPTRTGKSSDESPRSQNEQAIHEQLQTKPAQASDSGRTILPPIVREVLHSSGQPLDAATRGFMEPRFGHDFSQVRVHTDSRADESAREVNAIAYTMGRDVVLGQGRYEPASTEGRRLLAHELTHVVQQRHAASGIMRQAASGELVASPAAKGEESPAHQCAEDAQLDAEYDAWIHYDPKKDAEETALVNRINKEVFGPINQERNKIAADSFENTEAKKKAFPTDTLEPDATPARVKLFNTPTYGWLHSAAAEDRDRQQSIGVTQPVGDLSATGKVVPQVFGVRSPPATIWDFRGDKARAAGSELDVTISSSGIEAKGSVSGYAEFKDPKGSRIFVPQLGFGLKPRVDTRQVMCHDVAVVKPGRAKRLGGPTGQDVTGSSVGDILHGGKHFFGKGTSPTTTGKGEVLGHRSGPNKPVSWDFNQLPDDPDTREKIDETMKAKADKIMDDKRRSYENLKQFYLARAAFIAKYRGSLK